MEENSNLCGNLLSDVVLVSFHLMTTFYINSKRCLNFVETAVYARLIKRQERLRA